MLLSVPMVNLLFLLGNISLPEYTKISSSVDLLMGMFSFILGNYLGVELLGHMCLNL